jgi:hypothetical protein
MHRVVLALLLVVAVGVAPLAKTRIAPTPESERWQALDPVVYSNLALFPVTTAPGHSSNGYLTLDEGLASGEVVVSELGTLVRCRPPARCAGQAQVNTLALVNRSKRTLILLAGEIVTGGKQDRVISKDRLVLPDSEPLPLDVFCVEPGRWSGASVVFEGKSYMAAPAVREKAAVARNQQEVWDATGQVRTRVAETAGVAGSALQGSSSYAELERSEALKGRIDAATGALQSDYERALRGALRGQHIVGVVVAINGEVVWADLFADAGLFERYWPKLLRSYVVEALSVSVVEHARAGRADAQRFLMERSGREIIETEPGQFRLRQVDHPRYSLFELASLFEKGEPVLHFNKLRKERVAYPEPIRPLRRER